MRYFITGGAGFIGSHLADRLIEAGHTVHAYDNLSTGRVDNVRHLLDHDRFELTVGNVLDAHTMEQGIRASDRVVHLAAAVGVKRVMDEPVETIQTNVGGTENALKLAHYHDTRILIASTSEVYGKAMQKDASLDALAEDGDWTLGATSKRRWAYACSKAMDEFLAQAYHDEYGLDVVAVRFFNTVGPRQSGRYGMVIPTFVRQALAGEPLTVHGDGEQTRCFTHVADAVDAVTALLDADAVAGEVFNVGNTDEISINDLAARIVALTAATSDIVHVPYDEVYGPGFEDMKRRTPDLSKVHEAVGYVPQHDTDAILRDVIDYARGTDPDASSAHDVADAVTPS